MNKPKSKNPTSKPSVKSFDTLPKQLFENVLNNFKCELILFDASEKILFINDSALKQFGVPKNQILNTCFHDFVRNNITMRRWDSTYFKEVLKNKKPVIFTINRIGKDRSVKTFSITASYLKFNGKEYILSTGNDVSEKIHLENKVKEAEFLHKLFSEQSSEAIFAVDLNGSLLFVNKTAETVLKYPIKKALGANFMKFIFETSKDKAKTAFFEAKKGHPTVMGELETVDYYGKIIPIEFSTTPLYKNGKVFQIHTIFRDISKRRDLERFILESEKNAAIQQFISGTSQEIQNPLKSLLESSHNLIDKYKDRHYEYIGFKEFKEIMNTLETMRDQIKYCTNTTEKLLSINKKKTGLERNFCDINTVINDVIKTLKHQLSISEVKIKLFLSRKLPPARISPLDFHQIVVNILTNSIQSILKGGKIQIRSEFNKDTNMINIRFKDDGQGIPRENLSRVFEPFFTTKNRGLEKNAGLGLTIVYSIIKSAKGEINLHSSVRKGTTVNISLPIYKNGNKIKF